MPISVATHVDPDGMLDFIPTIGDAQASCGMVELAKHGPASLLGKWVSRGEQEPDLQAGKTLDRS